MNLDDELAVSKRMIEVISSKAPPNNDNDDQCCFCTESISHEDKRVVTCPVKQCIYLLDATCLAKTTSLEYPASVHCWVCRKSWNKKQWMQVLASMGDHPDLLARQTDITTHYTPQRLNELNQQSAQAEAITRASKAIDDLAAIGNMPSDKRKKAAVEVAEKWTPVDAPAAANAPVSAPDPASATGSGAPLVSSPAWWERMWSGVVAAFHTVVNGLTVVLEGVWAAVVCVGELIKRLLQATVDILIKDHLHAIVDKIIMPFIMPVKAN